MGALKKGQVITVVCLATTIAIVALVPVGAAGARGLAIFSLIICAISIVLSHLLSKRDRQLQQKFALLLSIAIACVVVGALLLQRMWAMGLVLVVVGFLPGLLAIRLLLRKVRNPNAS
ncbi:MAG: hypothetical protein WA192_13275 [Candidatus Acidiferrales bacterium]